MNLASFLNPIGIMFCIAASGIVLRKINIINANIRLGLTDLLILFVLPCNIIMSFQTNFDVAILLSFATVLVISILVQALSMLLCSTIYRKQPNERKASLQFATLVPNNNFMGIPITESFYGAYGVMFTAIYLVPQRILTWSVGVGFFTRNTESGSFKKALTHPCVVAVVIGILLMAIQIPLPHILYVSLMSIGNCTTPLAMIIIGSVLAEATIVKNIAKTITFFCIIRLILIPLVVFAGCFFLNVEKTIAGVCVLLVGMPAGAITSVLAARYKSDEHFASMCVTVSTILSPLTLSAFYYLTENLL